MQGCLANEVETVEACPWSSYGITRASHGLRLLGINPSLTRAQILGLPGPSTDCNPTVIYHLKRNRTGCKKDLAL